MLGLATGDGSEPSQPNLIWGKAILVVSLFLLGWRIARERTVSRGLAVALAVGLAFWIAAALNRDLSRLPTSSRFQYPSAVFLLLIAAEMLRGRRIHLRAVVSAALVASLAIVGGISLMQREHSEHWVPYANSLRSSLAAVQIAGGNVDPRFQVAFPPDIQAPTRAYFSAVDRVRLPGHSTKASLPPGRRASGKAPIARSRGRSAWLFVRRAVTRG